MALAPFRLLRSASFLAAAAVCSFAGFAAAEFTTLPGWDRQVFPSYAVATATLRTDEAGADADATELGDPRGLWECSSNRQLTMPR